MSNGIKQKLRNALKGLRKKKASIAPHVAPIEAPNVGRRIAPIEAPNVGRTREDDDGASTSTAPARDPDAEILAAVEASSLKKLTIYDGPFFSYEPRNSELRGTCDAGVLTVEIEFPKALEKLAKKDRESYPLALMHEAAADAVRAVAERHVDELRELDQLMDDLYAGRVHLDMWEVVGRAVDLQNKAVTGAEQAEEDAAAAALKVLSDRKGNRWAKIKYRVTSALRIGGATVSGGSAVARAVGSGGADVTAYVQAAKAFYKVCVEIKSLLQTVDAAWQKVEPPLLELKTALNTSSLSIPETFEELKAHPVLIAFKGSYKNVKKGLKTYAAKIGGRQDKMDALTSKMNKLTDAATALRGHIESEPPTRDAASKLATAEEGAAAAIEAAFAAGEALTAHLEHQQVAKEIVAAYKQEKGTTEAWVRGAKGVAKTTIKLAKKADEVQAKLSEGWAAVETVASLF